MSDYKGFAIIKGNDGYGTVYHGEHDADAYYSMPAKIKTPNFTSSMELYGHIDRVLAEFRQFKNIIVNSGRVPATLLNEAFARFWKAYQQMDGDIINRGINLAAAVERDIVKQHPVAASAQKSLVNSGNASAFNKIKDGVSRL